MDYLGAPAGEFSQEFGFDGRILGIVGDVVDLMRVFAQIEEFDDWFSGGEEGGLFRVQ